MHPASLLSGAEAQFAPVEGQPNGVPINRGVEMINIPIGHFAFRVEDGTVFSLDPIETLEETHRIRQVVAKMTEEGQRFPHLHMFKAWLEAKVPGKKFGLAACDLIWDEMEGRYHREKKERWAALGLQSSTVAPTPDDLDLESVLDSGPTSAS